MKVNMKLRIVIFLAIILIVLPNNMSYGTAMTSKPQIKTRGLVFNTGTSSDQIRLLKDFFRARGDKNVPWGYSYDNKTKELVRNFQRSNGLNSDGIAGKSTINKMNKEIADKGYGMGLRIPYTDVKGDMLIVNKSSNTLYLLKNGVIQQFYPVATGKTAGATPRGKHSVVVKYKNPAWGGAGLSDPIPGGVPNNPLGTRWIGISYGGGGKYGVHGNSKPRSIGTYASLGCIRMFNEDVEKLYETVKIKTPIWIGSEKELESYGVKFKSNLKAKKVEKPKPKSKPKKVNLTLNGKKIELKDSIINKNGTTYHPFREILEMIGGEVFWDDENKKAIGILDENYVEFQMNNNKYRNNDGDGYLPKGQKAFNNKGKAYVPIRNLMESLGYDVKWDQQTTTVIINKRVEEIEENEEIDENEEAEEVEEIHELEDSEK